MPSCSQVLLLLVVFFASHAIAGSAAGQEQASPSEFESIDPHADDESPELGVVVASCPGDGVCVLDTLVSSPANQAGIQRGDYILAVNDTDIATPLELKHLIEELSAGEEVNVKVWRRGQEFSRRIKLASEAEQPSAGHAAWLGVVVGESGDRGEATRLEVEEVWPESPASRAGLRVGDRLLEINGVKLADTKTFFDQIQQAAPGETIELEVRRGEQEQKLMVQLGHLDDAPLRWLRRAFRPPPSARRLQPGSPPHGEREEIADGVLEEMRRQIRALRKDLNNLKRQRGEDVDGSSDSAAPAPVGANRNRNAVPFASGSTGIIGLSTNTLVRH